MCRIDHKSLIASFDIMTILRWALFRKLLDAVFEELKALSCNVMYRSCSLLSLIVCCRYVGQIIGSQAAKLPDKEAIKLESKIELRNTLSSFYFSRMCLL